MTVRFIFMVYRKYKPQRHVCSKINLNNLFLKESVIILMIYAYKDIEKYKMDWLSSLFWIYIKHFSKEQALRGIGKLQWIGTLGRVMNKKNLKWFKLRVFFWTVFRGEPEDTISWDVSTGTQYKQEHNVRMVIFQEPRAYRAGFLNNTPLLT